MSADNFALAGAIILAALPLACIAFGLLHYLHARVKAMSLVQDAEVFLTRIETAVEAAAKPMIDKIASLESDLAAKAAELVNLASEKDALMARLAQFEQTIENAIAPHEVTAA